MLFIIEILSGDIGVFAGYPDPLMVFQQLSGGSRTADTHLAFAEAKVQHFVNIPVFFQNGVLADHADISSTILYIGGCDPGAVKNTGLTETISIVIKSI